MKVLITGTNGFLGHYLIGQLLNNHHQVIATSRGGNKLSFEHANLLYEEMDFTDEATVHTIFNKHQPSQIIHAGAMSKPDDCELNKTLADKINIEGTAVLLAAAKQYAAAFLFCSTDFVFDGARGMYTEEDELSPVNYYGVTKLKAEALVKQYQHNWSIVRTVLVYGKAFNKRNNIVTVIKEKLEKGEPYAVFNDQVRTPTYAEDFAKGVIAMLEKNATGIYNICGEEVLTPYDMAIAIAEYLQLDASVLKKATVADFAQAAMRPPKTGLTIDKAKKDLGYQPISFKEGLKKSLQ